MTHSGKPLLLSVSRITILIEAGSLPQIVRMIEIENANGTMGKAFPVESPEARAIRDPNHLGSCDALAVALR